MGEGSNAPNKRSTHRWPDLTVILGASVGEGSNAPHKKTTNNAVALPCGPATSLGRALGREL
eukprot:382738-Pyramimonas_sp.AAC.1